MQEWEPWPCSFARCPASLRDAKYDLVAPIEGGDMQRREFFGGLGLGAAGLALPTDGPATAGEASDDRAQRRAHFLDHAKRGLERAVDPASPDCMNFTDGSQPLVDAASSARSLRKRRSLSTAGRSPTASGRFTCWPR
jgi:hypothetical protein